ncbi:DUF1365 domain-containing protein [Kitasatospora sp. NPDC049285]|uniref:DUF1365 domain-containing protein n=1 Tax=Kitasatospora sp. NPDC049285 TaxID=3157096 RepID=UPI003437A4D2
MRALTRPLPGAALYPCTITHVRTAPIPHAFRHRGYLWLVDLDQLPRLPRPLRPLARFDARDHLTGGDLPRGRRSAAGASIRATVQAELARHGVDLDGGRILMLTQARVLGHVFNPLTLYWCHRRDGSSAGVLAEVHNTYGGRHTYLLHPDERGRATAAKDFYVSPFHPPVGEYRMTVPEPGADLALSVVLKPPGGRQFTAAVRGVRRTATPAALLRLAVRHPLAPLAAAARIRLQGVRLWLAGLPVFPRPARTARTVPEGVRR